MHKILLLSLPNRFLDRGANLPPPVQIGCKNTSVYIGLNYDCFQKLKGFVIFVVIHKTSC